MVLRPNQRHPAGREQAEKRGREACDSEGVAAWAEPYCDRTRGKLGRVPTVGGELEGQMGRERRKGGGGWVGGRHSSTRALTSLKKEPCRPPLAADCKRIGYWPAQLQLLA